MKQTLWVAVTVMALACCSCDFEPRVAAEMVSMDQSRPLGGEKALSAEIRFDIGSLEISGGKNSTLYSMDLEYDKATYQPEVRYQPPAGGGEGLFTFRLESNHRIGLRSDHQRNRLRLDLTKTVPVKLSVNTGVGDARIALSGIQLARLEIESGVGGSRLSSYEPNPVVCDLVRIKNGVGSLDAVGLGNLNFRELDFEGGVGGANLDFSGAWKQDADIRVQVGVGGVSLKIPRDIGVRVEAEKHFLSGLHLDGFRKTDSYYYSESYDRAKIRATVRVATGVGGFRLSWI